MRAKRVRTKRTGATVQRSSTNVATARKARAAAAAPAAAVALLQAIVLLSCTSRPDAHAAGSAAPARQRAETSAARAQQPAKAVSPSMQAATEAITTPSEKRIASFEERLRKSPEDASALAGLSAAYMDRARATGDASWYARAGAACQKSLAAAPGNYDAI